MLSTHSTAFPIRSSLSASGVDASCSACSYVQSPSVALLCGRRTRDTVTVAPSLEVEMSAREVTFG
jgi:hypothetical protein